MCLYRQVEKIVENWLYKKRLLPMKQSFLFVYAYAN